MKLFFTDLIGKAKASIKNNIIMYLYTLPIRNASNVVKAFFTSVTMFTVYPRSEYKDKTVAMGYSYKTLFDGFKCCGIFNRSISIFYLIIDELRSELCK